MASLESIHFTPMREVVESGVVRWELDKLASPIAALPQVFWEDGEPWSEVNHWALTKAKSIVGGDIGTVTSLMKHLTAYASWLESKGMDWRHFPMRMTDRAIVQFRGELIRQRDELGVLAPSTATARMAAVIQFYRHAHIYGFVERSSPMWRDKLVHIRLFDNVGFERTMLRISSELAIPNRARPGERLEDGLTPLRPEHARQLLKFTEEQGLLELHYMLSLGVLSGARIETISTLGVRQIEDAIPDPSMPGFCRVAVGPGTGVETKFDVSGDLLIPDFLIDALKGYAYSMRRLRRQALASEAQRGLLFLTVRGSPYGLQTFTRLMTDLRRRTVAAGMRFMGRFRFHQTRATYGTIVMELALKVTNAKNAMAFLRDAMLHKDEAVTLRYVRFVQKAPVKALIGKEFASVFSGVVNRDWNQFHA
ncbi:integrase family protein [Burkholderia pseudomallei]|uniref:tyrosine-type recombinase/integrase n=1 Tax=Burkholderia pseudomallei TaxID=28450 RepID=UPI000F08F66E|nr:tyrosine-type recombinase/integrase [Burkholderia pseudomallei]VBT21833.1 integrase family protein [Burkholderia pseudomallei]